MFVIALCHLLGSAVMFVVSDKEGILPMPFDRFVLSATVVVKEPNGESHQDGRELIATFSKTIGISVSAASTFGEAFKTLDIESGGEIISVSLMPDLNSYVQEKEGRVAY